MNKNLYSPRRQSNLIDVKRRPRTTDAGAVTLPEISKPLIVHRGTDCFVTPPEVAARIADYANLESGQIVYDPEAGTGNILQAIIDTEEQVELFGHELNYTLFESLVSRFLILKTPEMASRLSASRDCSLTVMFQVASGKH